MGVERQGCTCLKTHAQALVSDAPVRQPFHHLCHTQPQQVLQQAQHLPVATQTVLLCLLCLLLLVLELFMVVVVIRHLVVLLLMIQKLLLRLVVVVLLLLLLLAASAGLQP